MQIRRTWKRKQIQLRSGWTLQTDSSSYDASKMQWAREQKAICGASAAIIIWHIWVPEWNVRINSPYPKHLLTGPNHLAVCVWKSATQTANPVVGVVFSVEFCSKIISGAGVLVFYGLEVGCVRFSKLMWNWIKSTRKWFVNTIMNLKFKTNSKQQFNCVWLVLKSIIRKDFDAFTKMTWSNEQIDCTLWESTKKRDI